MAYFPGNSSAQQRHIPLTAEEVKAYLRDNADLVQDDAELMALLLPGIDDDDNVVSFQSHLVKRLQQQLALAQTDQTDLLRTARGNMNAQERVHVAVLRFLEAQSFAHLIHIISHEMGACLDVDAVRLCVEVASDDIPSDEGLGDLVMLPIGMVDMLIGQEEPALLQSDELRMPELYGFEDHGLQSEALVRLNIADGAPDAMLAMASLDPDMFCPDHGTELLDFLARALERCLRAWLDLPEG